MCSLDTVTFDQQKMLLTEMWQNHEYLQVGDHIRTADWTPSMMMQFASYFCRYLGVKQLELLYKFV